MLTKKRDPLESGSRKKFRDSPCFYYALVLLILVLLLVPLYNSKESRTEPVREIQYNQIEDDPEIDSRIISSYISENDLIIEYSSNEKPRIEGLFQKYKIENNKVIIYNYSNERFKFIFGKNSDVYEFYIEISKALHLDENKASVADVYDYVSARDNLTYVIPENNYLRISFKQNLTSTRDITFYGKSNNNGKVEVYEKDSDVKIADFGVIGDYREYKIYLTNLTSKQQDTFDLKVVSGDVEFDYVVDPDPWLSGWSKRIKLTTNHTKIDEDLTWFPITVFLKEGNGDTEKVFDEVGTNYLKIAIADDSNTQYYVEIEQWDEVNKVGVLHFGREGMVLPSDADKDFYLYYDSNHENNTDYVGDIGSEAAQKVWENASKMIQHMKDYNASYIKDSTKYGNNGMKKAENEPIEADRKIGKAQRFDGEDDYIEIPITPSLSNEIEDANQITAAWWMLAERTDKTPFSAWGDKSGYGYWTDQLFWTGDGNKWITLKMEIPDTSQWHYYVFTFNGTKCVGYVDREVVNQVEEAFQIKATNIGKNRLLISGWNKQQPPTHCFKGLIDEIRIYNRSLSAAEIKASYHSGNDSLLSYGNEEVDITPPSITIIYPQNTTYTVNVSELNYTALDSQSGLSACWYSTDNGITNSTPDPTCSNFINVISNEGSNTWTVYARDYAGNENSSSVTFFKDTTPPTVTLIFPADGAILEGAEQTFICNATDSSGLVSISLYHNATGTWHLNATHNVSGTSNQTSFTISLPFTTFVWNCKATDSNGLEGFAPANFTLTTLPDATPPSITSESITSDLTSGEIATVRANVTDSSPLSVVWVTVNDTDGTLTNYTMSREGSTDFYNGSFEVGKKGIWYFKVYANDSWGNLNDSRPWNSFNVSKPSATPQNEIYPTYALPSSSITITAQLAATDLLKEVNVSLNIPSGFEFPFASYPQIQSKGNFSAGDTKTARWFIYLPNNKTTYTFNVTWTDKYGNWFQGDNKAIVVTYDATNLTNATNVNIIAFPELEAGAVLETEIQVRDINGNFVNASSVKISLYDPNNNLVVDSVNYTSQLGTGRYFYNYTTPTAPTGQWLIVVNVTRQGNSFIDREYFRLTGGPFDIREITIIDSTAPTLKISAIIENQGEGTTDIVMNWNLTREDTGAVLDSGQDTIGVKRHQTYTYTITPSTTYTGEARITFLGIWSSTEKAGAFKIFTITSAPEGAGGGAGGGGRIEEAIIKPTLKPKEEIKVEEKEGKIEIIDYPKRIEIIKTESLEKTIGIKNNGKGNLNNVKLVISGLPFDSYTITPEKYDIILPNETKTFKIIFKTDIEAKEYKIKFIIISDKGSKEVDSILVVKEKRPLISLPEVEISKETWIMPGVAGFIIILVLIVLILWGQKRLKEQLREMKKQIMKSKTKEDIKEEMIKVKRDFDALETMYKDDLIPKSSYEKNKEKLNKMLEQLKEEFNRK